jgi:hypothetical protein
LSERKDGSNVNTPIDLTLRNSEGRYLTADEKRSLLDFAAALPDRLRAAEEVERHEDAAIRQTLDEIRRRFPGFETAHDQAFAKGYRDLQLLVRFDVQAMIAGDATLLDDKVLYWHRAILSASNMTPKFVRQTYTLLRDQFEERLSAEAFAALRPYFDRNVSVLSDFPEPTVAAV